MWGTQGPIPCHQTSPIHFHVIQICFYSTLHTWGNDQVTSTCIKHHWPTPVCTSLSLSKRVASSSTQGEETYQSKYDHERLAGFACRSTNHKSPHGVHLFN